MRQVYVTNESSVLSDSQVQAALAALQTQVNRDFAPAWGITCQLNFAGKSPPLGVEVIHVLDDTDQADALGYHATDQSDNPVGFVFARTAQQYGESWTVTLSHELLEQLVDPYCTLLSYAENWRRHRVVAIAQEVSDPVEGDSYLIGNTPVSNFVLPLYFSQPPLPTGSTARVDFLGRLHQPLDMTPGGYIAYTTNLQRWSQVFGRLTSEMHKVGHRHSRRHRRMVRAEPAPIGDPLMSEQCMAQQASPPNTRMAMNPAHIVTDDLYHAARAIQEELERRGRRLDA